MKLLVFAHTPPPHHGQSVMVQIMLDGWGGDWRLGEASSWRPGDEFGVKCYHVNAQLSDDLGDIGGLRMAKIFRLLRYCAEAVWCRFRYGITTFYYVPAPAKKSAVLRDWVVMLLVRPWFRKTIFHWHAYGLGGWAKNSSGFAAGLTKVLMTKADVSVVLTDFNRDDAAVFHPRKITVVPNGLTDPCADFDQALLPERWSRPRGEHFRVLFLGHCTREKGLFDAIDAVAAANARLRELKRPLRLQLTVAGDFMNESERGIFTTRIQQDDLRNDLTGEEVVTYAGFLTSVAKDKVLRSHDALCFPTFYEGETFGLTLLEAMAYGLPVVASCWRGLPEILPPAWPYSVPPHDIDALADALLGVVSYDDFASLRQRFVAHFTSEKFLQQLATALAPLR